MFVPTAAPLSLGGARVDLFVLPETILHKPGVQTFIYALYLLCTCLKTFSTIILVLSNPSTPLIPSPPLPSPFPSNPLPAPTGSRRAIAASVTAGGYLNGEVLTVQSTAAEGQHLATIEVRPYVSTTTKGSRLGSEKPLLGERNDSDNTDNTIASTSTTTAGGGSAGAGAAEADDRDSNDDPLSQIFDRFGLCADEGALWVEWVVPPPHLHAALSFGVLSHAAAVDPDARYYSRLPSYSPVPL